ncbi:MAG TPA: methionyl-tRNA formyltransferase, partial [Bacillota bacterium]|nr:methionyl-tRNA formyltransferase [Bacillota bacterium]
TGDIIAKDKVEILDNETADQVHDKLALLGGKILKEVISLFEDGHPIGIPQENDMASYCKKIDKSMCELDWDNDAIELKNLIRGLTPWPGAYTYLKDKRIKVWKTREWEKSLSNEERPGTIVVADINEGLVVSCRNSFLQIVELQGEGGRRMSSEEYLRGNQITVGSILGRQESE